MLLTINITPELEAQLRDEAAKEGLDANAYIVHTLEERLRPSQDHRPPHLPEAEAYLLQQINQGLPQEMWQRYHELLDKRRAEILTPDEQAALIALSDQIEDANAHRIEHLVELARLRQTSLGTLMQQLGIEAPPYV
jgi:hypothetical protein